MLKRTAMSTRELERVEVMGRVAHKALKLTDAAALLELSYRQVKRLWRRYRRRGRKGLQHGNVGRASNRSKPTKFRHRVLSLIRQKYSGSEGERFGPTLAAEHLAEEDGITIDHEALRGCRLAEGLWSPRQTEETLPTEGTQGTFRRTGTAGREFSRLAGRAWSWGLPHEHGGRRHEHVAGSPGQRRDHSGPQPESCNHGLRNMACRAPSIPMGRMCTHARRRRPSSCGEKSRSRGSGGCVRS